MPLSTSNSNLRAKRLFTGQRWFFTWCLITLTCITGIGGWEAYWRYHGFQPTINDDWTVWSALRRQANNNKNAIALVGSSRIMLGLDPVILEKSLLSPVYMLAIDGSNPLPVLEQLAGDPNFNGIVIASMVPYWLAGNTPPDSDRSLKWLRKYTSQSLSSKIESKIAIFTQSHLVFRSSSLAPGKLWKKWRQGKKIIPPYAPIRPDRFREADYTRTNLVSLRAARERRTYKLHNDLHLLNQREFQLRITAIQGWVDAIQSRGGQVVFIRMPSCGVVREIEDTITPRAEYWDVFAQEISAPAFHFEDYPQLQDTQCTDGSHLQHSDAIRFTRNMVELLKQNLTL